MDYVRPLATNPHVQYALQQTWAYARNSTHPGFYRYGKDQQTMYDDVVFAYSQAARKQHISIVIPTGTPYKMPAAAAWATPCAATAIT